MDNYIEQLVFNLKDGAYQIENTIGNLADIEEKGEFDEGVYDELRDQLKRMAAYIESIKREFNI